MTMKGRAYRNSPGAAFKRVTGTKLEAPAVKLRRVGDVQYLALKIRGHDPLLIFEHAARL